MANRQIFQHEEDLLLNDECKLLEDDANNKTKMFKLETLKNFIAEFVKDKIKSWEYDSLKTEGKSIIESANEIYATTQKRMVSMEEIDLVTEAGFFVDALAVKELNRKLLPWDAWRQSFLGTHIYRLQFGDINGNIIQTNQLSIPWLPSEVTVALSKINIPGAGTIAIDYKSAYLTTEGGLYIYCSTAGAAGVASLKWQVVDATIVIQRK